MPMLLGCSALHVTLGSSKILHDVSLQVDTGEIITLIGPNGSGKTTLLRALLGAVQPSQGEVFRAPALRLGYVPQHLHLDDSLPLTVKRFMTLPRTHPAQAIRTALEDAGLPDLETRQMRALSGGEFQRVLLARALLAQPQILILDEATRGMDHRATAAFYRQIGEVRDRTGCGVLMVSHELHVVMRTSDRVICLNQSICCEGKPEAVSQSEQYNALFGLEAEDESALYLHRNHHHSEDSGVEHAG